MLRPGALSDHSVAQDSPPSSLAASLSPLWEDMEEEEDSQSVSLIFMLRVLLHFPSGICPCTGGTMQFIKDSGTNLVCHPCSLMDLCIGCFGTHGLPIGNNSIDQWYCPLGKLGFHILPLLFHSRKWHLGSWRLGQRRKSP